MTRYRYKAYDRAGAVELGEISAASVPDALKQLGERGLIPVKAEAIADPAGDARPARRFRRQLTLKDYARFTSELAVLLRAGLPLDEGLKILADQSEQSHVKDVTQRVLQSVIAGRSLSAALTEHAPEAPNYLSSLIKAGEARGALAPTLTELAKFIQIRVDIQTKLRAALTYPIILAVTAMIAITVILTVLVPALLPLFSQSGAEPPVGLRIANTFSVWLTGNWIALLGCFSSLAIGGKLLARREGVRAFGDRAVLALPLIGPLSRKTSVAVLARTLGTLLRNGVALIPALQIAATAVPNRSIAASVLSAAADINEGKRLSKALERTGQIQPMALRFIAIGEESSKLDDMLLHLAEIFEAETQLQTDQLMVMMVPLMTIVIGLSVGGLIMTVMDAILAANEMALR
jgi:general secretion pathway protein F